jgi:hypothetical protein
MTRSTGINDQSLVAGREDRKRVNDRETQAADGTKRETGRAGTPTLAYVTALLALRMLRSSALTSRPALKASPSIDRDAKVALRS